MTAAAAAALSLRLEALDASDLAALADALPALEKLITR
jgi:hypothetical protein